MTTNTPSQSLLLGAVGIGLSGTQKCKDFCFRRFSLDVLLCNCPEVRQMLAVKDRWNDCAHIEIVWEMIYSFGLSFIRQAGEWGPLSDCVIRYVNSYYYLIALIILRRKIIFYISHHSKEVRLLGIGMLVASIFSTVSPSVASKSFIMFCLVRMFMGVGMGPTAPVLHGLLGK